LGPSILCSAHWSPGSIHFIYCFPSSSISPLTFLPSFTSSGCYFIFFLCPFILLLFACNILPPLPHAVFRTSLSKIYSSHHHIYHPNSLLKPLKSREEKQEQNERTKIIGRKKKEQERSSVCGLLFHCTSTSMKNMILVLDFLFCSGLGLFFCFLFFFFLTLQRFLGGVGYLLLTGFFGQGGELFLSHWIALGGFGVWSPFFRFIIPSLSALSFIPCSCPISSSVS